jgi:hypothetical protein
MDARHGVFRTFYIGLLTVSFRDSVTLGHRAKNLRQRESITEDMVAKKAHIWESCDP